jgi:hypothetical protein
MTECNMTEMIMHYMFGANQYLWKNHRSDASITINQTRSGRG